MLIIMGVFSSIAIVFSVFIIFYSIRVIYKDIKEENRMLREYDIAVKKIWEIKK